MARTRDYPDHRRALMLLWRSAEEPSPRSGLTVDRIVEAAVAIADADGLPALSMRRVAERLGVGVMSLYTYVPGKDELVILMVDSVYAELPTEDRGDETWRERLEAIARDRWAHFRRHTWLIDVPLSRPIVGPHAMDRYEHELGAVEGLGLDDLEMNAVIELIGGHVEGMAGRAADIRRDAERSGVSDDEWWYSVLPVLVNVMADRSYPLSARVGSTIGAPHLPTEYGFEFGLTRILDGVEALIRSRASDTDDAR
jgi:AcrR family transcriptional regulator